MPHQCQSHIGESNRERERDGGHLRWTVENVSTCYVNILAFLCVSYYLFFCITPCHY